MMEAGKLGGTQVEDSDRSEVQRLVDEYSFRLRRE